MKIGVLQYNIEKNSVDKNLKKIKNLINEDLDLVILPETGLTGYYYKDLESVKKVAENIPDGIISTSLIGLAKEKNCHIIGNLIEKDGDKNYITSILVNKDGLIGKQRKIHLTGDEKQKFIGGESQSVFNVNGVNIGMSICFDGWFPEPFRSLNQKGAQLICHSALISNPKSMDIIKVRAIENRVFIALSNACGDENFGGNLVNYRGESKIIDPNGNILTKAKNNEGLITYEINPEIALNKVLDDGANIFDEISIYKG